MFMPIRWQWSRQGHANQDREGLLNLHPLEDIGDTDVAHCNREELSPFSFLSEVYLMSREKMVRNCPSVAQM